jgi:hypothetical protein
MEVNKDIIMKSAIRKDVGRTVAGKFKMQLRYFPGGTDKLGSEPYGPNDHILPFYGSGRLLILYRKVKICIYNKKFLCELTAHLFCI